MGKEKKQKTSGLTYTEYKRIVINQGEPYPPCVACDDREYKHCRDRWLDCLLFRQYCNEAANNKYYVKNSEIATYKQSIFLDSDE